eukprot:1763199-Amphidinium_carterae.2
MAPISFMAPFVQSNKTMGSSTYSCIVLVPGWRLGGPKAVEQFCRTGKDKVDKISPVLLRTSVHYA